MPTPEHPETPPSDKGKRGGTRKRVEEPPVDAISAFLEILANARIEHSRETEAERESRLDIAEKDAEHERDEKARGMAHRRRVEVVSLYAVLAVVAVVCPVCLWVLTDDARSAEKRAWAAPLLTLIVGGLIGFLTGRVPGRPQEK